MRVLFMGTPEFAVPSLEAIIAAGHTVVGVFSQPDKPVGRHQNKLQPTPVKETALAHDIPVYQPTKLRDGTALALIRELSPDLIVVAAYGRILPDDILAAPRLGCINVHSSLLPRYRGSAPINWAVLNGDEVTGVTIMHMASAMDAGDIIRQVSTPIGPDETADALYDRLAVLGAQALAETLPEIENGTAARTVQNEDLVTLAPMLDKSLSPMDWKRSAHELHCQVRGLLPWPVASTDALTGETLKIYLTRETGEESAKDPGSVIAAGKDGIDVVCGDGKVLRILELQAAGGKRLRAADYLRGHAIAVAD